MQKSSFLKAITLIMALVMVLSAFLVGCSGDSNTTATQGGEAGNMTATGTAEDTSLKYEAEVKDLKGHEFTFYTKSSTAKHLDFVEVYAAGINGDKVNDAVFKRNSQLMATYNCTIAEERDSDPVKIIREALVSGEYVCDFLFINAKNAKDLAKSSLLVDYSQLENFNIEKGWIDQDAIDGLNMSGKVFFITGDGCTIDERRIEGMYFNIEIVEAWDNTVDLYQEVRDGKWTIDRMYEIVAATAQDLDGDDMITYSSSKDRYGYMAGYACDWCFVVGTGVSLSNYSSDGTIEVPLSPKRELLDSWSALRQLLTTNVRKVGAVGSQFRSGRCTFYCCNYGSLLNWADAEYKLGIIPYPKLNEQQDYYYQTALFTLGGYSIPASVNNDPNKDYEKAGFSSGAEMCGYFMEAYFYYSMNTLTPAFFEQVLAKQIVTDQDSVEMLELATAHRIYDPVVGFNFGGMANCFDNCGTPARSDTMGGDSNYDKLVSTYSGNVTAAREAITDYLTFIQEGATA